MLVLVWSKPSSFPEPSTAVGVVRQGGTGERGGGSQRRSLADGLWTRRPLLRGSKLNGVHGLKGRQWLIICAARLIKAAMAALA